MSRSSVMEMPSLASFCSLKQDSRFSLGRLKKYVLYRGVNSSLVNGESSRGRKLPRQETQHSPAGICPSFERANWHTSAPDWPPPKIATLLPCHWRLWWSNALL